MEQVTEVKKNKKKLKLILIIVGAVLVAAAIITTATLLSFMNRIFTVTFDTGTSAVIQAQEVKWGEKASEPETPYNSGKILNGWFNGNKQWNFESNKVYGDTVLTASWRDIQIERLEVTPNRTAFTLGETFSTVSHHPRMVVAVYDDGSTRQLEESEYSLTTNYEPNVEGNYTVTVSARSNGVSSTYDVKVARLLSLKISPNSYHQKAFLIGDEIDYTSLRLVLEFEGEEVEADYTALPLLKLSVEIQDETIKKTTRTVTATYGNTGKTAEYTVTHYDPKYLVPVSYSVTRPAYASVFLQYGKFSANGLQIVKRTVEFPYRNIQVDESEYTVTCDITKPGKATATVKANNADLFITYEVTVVETSNLTNLRIEIDLELTKRVYSVGEELKPTDIVARKVCRVNNTAETITLDLSPDQIIITSEFDPTATGTQVVSVSLMEDAKINAKYTVTVR